MYRIIWQYHSETLGPWHTELLRVTPLDPSADLFADLELLGIPEPVFSRSPLVLRSELLAAAVGEPEESADLAGYQHVFTRDVEAAELLCQRLAMEGSVRSVEVQGRPQPAVSHTPAARRFAADSGFLSLEMRSTPDFIPYQAYLDPAPEGVDARAAWRQPGGRGEGIGILDIEDGWNFAHEDLLAGQIGVLTGVNYGWDHGTAVLGVLSGDSNSFGIHGIAPRARVGTASTTYDFQFDKWNAAGAIETATRFLRPGDVLILEMQGPGPRASGQGQEGYLPVEFWQVERAAIKKAVAKGIYVVEAAGNGSENLDHPEYRGRLNRATDSGAVLVGGGASAWQEAPRSRIWWSNWGERLDVQGWGSDIVTAGGRDEPAYHDLFDHPESSRCYTQSFGGTSGATPIVAGTIACLSGCLQAAGRPVLPPKEMRHLLIETGTPQTDGPDGLASEVIGPLPNLAEALASLGL